MKHSKRCSRGVNKKRSHLSYPAKCNKKRGPKRSSKRSSSRSSKRSSRKSPLKFYKKGSGG
ncbi:MAG: hypothetical protein ACW98X_26460, partial [Promethearchaeota archaeon]